ncbi:MAG: 16S rRNA (cytosine(1402)-N(4))-methyltransferase RsmH [Syntrophobacteraceae bacterium]|nr:16S rRNA (cytosine(1402)-N(4))-methyltransferase RsmH [Syntrophobacteraceae bacterium]
MESLAEHVSVLCTETLAGLRIVPGGRYIDATIGAAGHAAGILEASSPDGTLLGLDADPEAIHYAGQALHRFGNRATLQAANFRTLMQTSKECGFVQVDGILMDLGLSSRQLAHASRGFSFNLEGPLDMRFDRDQGRPASDLVNALPQEELATLFWELGEERDSRRIARAIVKARPLHTTRELAAVIEAAAPRRGAHIHPATRTFQALRIAVNEELAAVANTLPQAVAALRPGGRLAVISFHSLEDRIVKDFFREQARDLVNPPYEQLYAVERPAIIKEITRKPLTASEEEIKDNPRARSAKLRVAEKL